MIKPNIRYIVMQDNDYFKRGNHIRLTEDGTLACLEKVGWIEKDEAEEILKTTELKIDTYWANVEVKKLQGRIAHLCMEYGVPKP